MKRLTSSVVSLFVSVSLALPPSTGAITDTSAASSAYENTSVDSGEITRTLSGFLFAGQPVSWLRIMNIARDPVIDWGTVQDDRGRVVQGELWLIVVRNDKFIYYHLTDTPNPAHDSTSYNGYTVKIKAAMTLQFYNFGFGSVVPIIGNDTDTFLVTTTELFIHSAFVEGETARLDARTGAEIAYLVHLYDEVKSYGFSSSGSRSSIAIQYFSPDGTELAEPFSQSWHESASSSSSSTTTCADVGDDVADVLHGIADAGQSVDQTVSRAYLVGLWMSPVISRKGPLFSLYALTVGVSSLGAQAMQALVHHVGAPVAGALAEGACEAVGGNDFAVLLPTELFDVVDIVFGSGAQLVCDRYEDEPTGSSSRETDDGGVEVTGLSERVCAEWHFEIVATVNTQ